MSQRTVLNEIFKSGRGRALKDPGDAGTINVDRSPATCALVSEGAETRTLNAPTRQGAIVTISMLTDGGDITLTVTDGFNEIGNTTFTFSEAGQFIMLVSIKTGDDTYVWRKVADHTSGNNSELLTGAGAGITAGVGTVYETSVVEEGGIITTTILIDLTGLSSVATDTDVIGVTGGGAAHIGQITAPQNGTIFSVSMQCIEVPAGGADDIDLYSATVGTAVISDLITDLTETVIITAGAAWAATTVRGGSGVPPANDYLYLCSGEAAAGDYTAGKFIITLKGYRA